MMSERVWVQTHTFAQDHGVWSNTLQVLSWLEQVKKIHEEEWSFIPVGGPLPVAQQPITAFGAAANLVHPATGYSIARSLREAPAFAQEVANLLRKQQAVGDTAESVWDALWPQEKRRQVCIVNVVAEQTLQNSRTDAECSLSTCVTVAPCCMGLVLAAVI